MFWHWNAFLAIIWTMFCMWITKCDTPYMKNSLCKKAILYKWGSPRRMLSFHCTIISYFQNLGMQYYYILIYSKCLSWPAIDVIKFGDLIKLSRELLISDMNSLFSCFPSWYEVWTTSYVCTYRYRYTYRYIDW